MGTRTAGGERAGPPTGASGDERAAVLLDGRADPSLLGGKAAALDRLVGWGLPVPPSGAVTVAAYRRLVAHPDLAPTVDAVRRGLELTAEEIDARFATTAFAPGDAAAIVDMARTVADGSPLAVRSSATVEDLDRSSFAGQYHSVLGVDADDADAVLDAVRAVFASLWHPAPRAYRRSFGIDDDEVAMAAVVMRMVPARRAGVVFTVDPGGALDGARVETVEGLGESLVSGRRTPEAVVLPRLGERGDVAPDVAEALELALRVEARAGRAQDVEWAWDGRRVWLVQARPITVTGTTDGDGFDDPAEVLDGADLTTAGIGEMLPGVLPPLLWTIDAHLVEEAFRRLLHDLGLLAPDIDTERALVRRVRGRAALDFTRLRALAGSLPGPAADELETQYFGARRPADADEDDRGASRTDTAHATTPGRLRRTVHDLRVLRSRTRYATEAATTTWAIRGILADRPDLDDLDGPEVLAYHLRLLDLGARATSAELGISADATASHRRLEQLLGRHLDQAEAQRVAQQLVAHVGFTAPLGPDASAAVFAGPTWRELERRPPTPVAGTVAADEAHEASALTALRTALRASERWDDEALLAGLRLRSMRRLAADTRSRLARREDAKAHLLALGGEVRRVHLHLGSRLTASGVLTEPTDVDLLTPAELRGLVRGEVSVAPQVIGHRRRWRVRNEQEGPLPGRFSGRPTGEPGAEATGERLEGWAASPGRFRGRVQVVTSADDVLARDAVLVAEATDPSWSPLFLRAGALVLDRGGPLSHAAILARELGLPAVLNVPGATRALAGREVTVDGDRGVVIVHDGDGAEP